MSIVFVTCPKCKSRCCNPTFFRSDAQCISCGEEFDMRINAPYFIHWWSKLMRKIFYKEVTI